jgi:hypothetical protein
MMNQRTEPFDDQDDDEMLQSISIPSLAAGPHEQELRRSLMREARGRADQRAAPAHPWLSRLAYALGVFVVLGAGAFWAAHQYRPSVLADRARPVVTTARSTTTNAVTGEGISAVIGMGGESLTEKEARQQADAVRAAIDKGTFQLEQALTAETGGRLFLYRITLADGRETTFGSDQVLIKQPWLRVKHEQELQQAIAADKGRPIGESVSDTGTRIYRYRVNLSDGTVETYGSDREPDPIKRQQRQKELGQVMAQKRGEVYKTIAGPDGTAIYLIKVTLVDGTVKTYASSVKPKGK